MAVGNHIAQVIDDMRIPTTNIHRMLHLGVRIDWADIRAEHIDAVKLGMPLILNQPASATRIAAPSHRNGLAGPVDHFCAVECQCAYRFGLLAIATADRADPPY